MSNEKTIEHDGIVQSVGSQRIFVKIFSQSACSACHSKSLCSALDIKEKIIEINTPDADSFKSGETVTVSMSESSGRKAVLLGYILPFIVLLTTLIVVIDMTNSELQGGLCALGVLIPYYFLLFLFRDSLKGTFIFRVSKKK